MNEQYPDAKKTNGFAIAGLVLAIVGFSILGLILSIIGLVKVKSYQTGKGLSIAGIIISILRLIFLVVQIVSLVMMLNNPDKICDVLEPNKESLCVKKLDGTYDCVLAVCNYDNVDTSKKQDPVVEEDNTKEARKNATLCANAICEDDCKDGELCKCWYEQADGQKVEIECAK